MKNKQVFQKDTEVLEEEIPKKIFLKPFGKRVRDNAPWLRFAKDNLKAFPRNCMFICCAHFTKCFQSLIFGIEIYAVPDLGSFEDLMFVFLYMAQKLLNYVFVSNDMFLSFL